MSYAEEKELYNVANVISTENVAFLMIKSTIAERVLSRTAGNLKGGKRPKRKWGQNHLLL